MSKFKNSGIKLNPKKLHFAQNLYHRKVMISLKLNGDNCVTECDVIIQDRPGHNRACERDPRSLQGPAQLPQLHIRHVRLNCTWSGWGVGLGWGGGYFSFIFLSRKHTKVNAFKSSSSFKNDCQILMHYKCIKGLNIV